MMPQVITLTDRAADQARALIAKSEDEVLGLRVGVKSTGCSGMSYYVEYAREQKKIRGCGRGQGCQDLHRALGDHVPVRQRNGLGGDRFNARFDFVNPNEKGRCGCGESFTV